MVNELDLMRPSKVMLITGEFYGFSIFRLHSR